MTRRLPTLSLALLLAAPAWAQAPVVADWSYIQIDDAKGAYGDFGEHTWLRYFGMDTGDVDGDGDLDAVSGRFVYHNPGGDMTAAWPRTELPGNVDALFVLDVDGDAYADVIAQALPALFWFEATNLEGTEWTARTIGTVPAASHVNSQGFERGQFVPGGREEFVIAGDGDIYLFEIPASPDTETWTRRLVASNTSDEGIGVGDLDGDGDLDLAAGRRADGETEPLTVVVYLNPGDGSERWPEQIVGTSNHPVDRVKIADLNGDGRADVVVSEERYPGLEPDGSLFWYEQPAQGDGWTRHSVVTQFSMNSLDVADLDEDGDLDLITNEHKGPRLETQLWRNDGTGAFTKHVLDTGKENHLGTQLADLDGDGDLDLVGQGWDQHQLMHVWRNDWTDSRLSWRKLSSDDGGLPPANGSNQQTAALAADVNGDGAQDIFIADRSTSPSLIALVYSPSGWVRHVIDTDSLKVEAGSAAHDIDGDGDLDVVFAGESQSNEVWWWENPFPDLDPAQPWTRRAVKSSGQAKHHDQRFIDVDHDGQAELVFWNQGAQTLFYAEIPDDPRAAGEWERYPIYQYSDDGEMQPRSTYPDWRMTNEHEGLAGVDMNGDGLIDVLGGGRWFERQSDGSFTEHVIDAGYTFTRAAAGQLIPGGRPEVLFVVGDGVGPLVMYQWEDGIWQATTLLEDVDNGHTLEIADIDGDGHLDIFNAEMRFGDANPDSEVRVLLGNGQGHFQRHVIARGYGVHEGQLADLDGDGDLDVVGKPYTWQAPLINIWLQDSE